MEIHRYDTTRIVTSWRDPLEDLVVQLQFLTSQDYVVEVSHRVHGITETQAKARAGLITSHAKASAAFIDQAMSGDSRTAFLPLYYAVLNLLKIYILFSKRHADLPKNRWHGATYDVYGKTSHTVITEQITLKAGGAIPLFYEVITGDTVSNNTKVKMGDVCPYIVDASAEWATAAGEEARVANLAFAIEDQGVGKVRPVVQVTLPKGQTLSSARQLKALRGFRKDPSETDKYVGKNYNGSGSNNEAMARSQVRCFLLYSRPGGTLTPISSRRLLLPEELPITLLFFYMSSVTRYRPDYLDRLMDSKYWPFLLTTRSQALTKFLFLFWSFVQQTNYYIMRD